MPNENAQGAPMPEDGDFATFEAWRTAEPKPDSEEVTAPPAATPKEAKTAPDSGTEEEQDSEETPANKKGGKGIQKRIDELTLARGIAERENAALKTRLEELERGSRPAKEEAQPATPAERPGEPKLDQFDTYEEYYRALVSFELDTREKTRAQNAATEKAVNSWKEREEASRQKHADYDEVLEAIEVPDTPALPALREALAESDLGSELLYHLAKNPDEAKRLAGLSPRSAVYELGKLEAKLSAAATPAPPPRKETAAPAPPRKVDGKFAPTKPVDDPELPYAEFERRREAQLRRH
jgi:hypothetical protein